MIQLPSQQHKLITILKTSTFLIFLGRAYQHIVWDPPYRTILWDEAILKNFVENVFGLSWNDYVTSLSAASSISFSIKTIGVFYLLCAIVTLFLKSDMKKVGKFFLFGGSIGLFILAVLYSKEKFFHVGQFFEYTIQFLTPILLYMVLFTSTALKKIRTIALIAIALTFSCHGLYAIGYYPRPGNFIDMIINILHISETNAHFMLKIVGILDFVIAITIFIPRLSYPSLLYAFIWGGLTAIARLVGHFHIDFFATTFNQWTWEVIIRLPHALIPLFVIIVDHPNSRFFKYIGMINNRKKPQTTT